MRTNDKSVAAALPMNTAPTSSFPERGVYFATHFRNWYEEAPPTDITIFSCEISPQSCGGRLER